MRIILILSYFIFLLSNASYSQFHVSEKYGYKIEVPDKWVRHEKIGANVDLKVADNNGNSIVIVITKLPTEFQNETAHELELIPLKDWELGFSEYLPNPKLIKSGKSYLDNNKAFWIHYTTGRIDEPQMYHINYIVFFEGLNYNITSSCFETELDKKMPIFMRSIKSFKL